MFTSSNKDTNNGIDPFTYNDQQRQFLNEVITATASNPKQDDPPFAFLNLPSPWLPASYGLIELEDQGVLLQDEHENGFCLHNEPLASACDSISETILNMVDSDRKDQEIYHELAVLRSANEQVPVRRRSSKRDRHSKINTAQGPRDRRMRLSLKVAREFFDVQDMLGFDKASKTVEWLLVQAKPSIEKLFTGHPGQMMNYSCKSASSPSECEVISRLDEAALTGSSTPKATPKASPSGNKKTRKTRPSSRKATVLQPVARESRAKARARARERTLEKKWSRKLDESKQSEDAMNHGLNQLSSCWSAFETGEKYPGKQSYNNMNPPPSFDAIAECSVPISQKQERLGGATGGLVDDSLVIMSKWSPSSFLSHLQNTGIPQELQFADFQSLSKTW